MEQESMQEIELLNLQILGPWNENEGQITYYKTNFRISPSSPASPKKLIKVLPSLPLRKDSFKTRSVRRQSIKTIPHPSQRSLAKDISLYTSIKSDGISSDWNSPLKYPSRVLDKPSKMDSERCRRYKISSKFGNKWLHLSHLIDKETLSVDIRKWKRLKTLDVECNDSYNFINRKKTII